MRRHQPFYLGATIGILGFAGSLFVKPDLAFEIGANLFFLTYLATTLSGVGSLTAAYLRQHARSSDLPLALIFAVTFGAVAIAVVSLFIVINRSSAMDGPSLVLSLASVTLGWFTIHMMTAIHYAHVYWQDGSAPLAASKGKGKAAPRGGLEFPGTSEPCGYDFLYFSYVVGMTAQTSDVAVTTTTMRRINLVHAIVSFFFNTVLVAAAVNVAVSFGH